MPAWLAWGILAAGATTALVLAIAFGAIVLTVSGLSWLARWVSASFTRSNAALAEHLHAALDVENDDDTVDLTDELRELEQMWQLPTATEPGWLPGDSYLDPRRDFRPWI